jgi:glycyl-tRNA synthetase alpha chain
MTWNGAAGHLPPGDDLRALGPLKPWNAAYVQPCAPPDRRPLWREPEPAAALLPVSGDPEAERRPNLQELYLESRWPRSASTRWHDIRFVEDDWESPTLGAWGLGWEVWCDGMEVSQFTYFQQVGGFDCKPVAGELTYGRLERLTAMYVQGVENEREHLRPGFSTSTGTRTGGRNDAPAPQYE